MTDSPFVLRMRALHQAREQASSLSEKIRLDEEIGQLMSAHARGETIEPVEAPADFKQAQANDNGE